jgi:hypothetical protein
VNARLHEAVALHRRGELAAARAIYEEILHARPRHADCLHLVGSVLYRRPRAGLPAADIILEQSLAG